MVIANPRLRNTNDAHPPASCDATWPDLGWRRGRPGEARDSLVPGGVFEPGPFHPSDIYSLGVRRRQAETIPWSRAPGTPPRRDDGAVRRGPDRGARRVAPASRLRFSRAATGWAPPGRNHGPPP